MPVPVLSNSITAYCVIWLARALSSRYWVHLQFIGHRLTHDSKVHRYITRCVSWINRRCYCTIYSTVHSNLGSLLRRAVHFFSHSSIRRTSYISSAFCPIKEFYEIDSWRAGGWQWRGHQCEPDGTRVCPVVSWKASLIRFVIFWKWVLMWMRDTKLILKIGRFWETMMSM